MSQIVTTMITEAEEDGILICEPFPFLSIAPASGAVLAFPSAIQVDTGTDRLYIADTNNHAIYRLRLDSSQV